MKNPCLECDHHLAGGDKNGALCMYCDKRWEYLNPTPRKQAPEPETEPEAHTGRLCKKCEVPKLLSDFPLNKECKGGHEWTCKDCKRETARLRRVAERVKLPPKPKKADRPEDFKKKRFCRACGDEKVLAEFVHNKASKDGRENTCKACRKLKNRGAIIVEAPAIKPEMEANVAPMTEGITKKVWVEPIEEIGMEIEIEATAPEPATNSEALRITTTIDSQAFEEHLCSKKGEEIVTAAIRSAQERRNDEATAPSTTDPLDVQIGGDHYRHFTIQPIEFITRNRLGFIQGDVVKRICRFNQPGGKGLQDLLKIKHEIDCLIKIDAMERIGA